MNGGHVNYGDYLRVIGIGNVGKEETPIKMFYLLNVWDISCLVLVNYVIKALK